MMRGEPGAKRTARGSAAWPFAFPWSRPFARALAYLSLCGVQVAMALVSLLWAEGWAAQSVGAWQSAQLVLAVVLCVLLLGNFLRVLRWRPRRSKRATPEVVQERWRIAQDLHDHVGSQLVGAMALLDVGDAATQPLAQALEQCLLDLRLLADSMDGEDEALPQRLARRRHPAERGAATLGQPGRPGMAPADQRQRLRHGPAHAGQQGAGRDGLQRHAPPRRRPEGPAGVSAGSQRRPVRADERAGAPARQGRAALHRRCAAARHGVFLSRCGQAMRLGRAAA